MCGCTESEEPLANQVAGVQLAINRHLELHIDQQTAATMYEPADYRDRDARPERRAVPGAERADLEARTAELAAEKSRKRFSRLSVLAFSFLHMTY